MKTNRYLYKIMSVAMIIVCTIACTDLEIAPTDKFTESTFWTSQAKAQLVLNRSYEQMYSNGYFFSTEVLSDNLFAGRDVPAEKLISSGLANAATSRFANEWADSYKAIKNCHVFLQNIDLVSNIDEEVKARMIAEIRFFRAFQYFRLTTWYGDIPFFTTDISLSESKTIGRTAQADVLTFVRTELAEVSEILPTKENLNSDENGRVTAGAAIALLARTYLYSNDWDGVVEQTEKLINSSEYGSYSLFSTYQGLFSTANEYNNEVMLDMTYIPIIRTWGDFFDLGPLSTGSRLSKHAPTQELVDEYLMLNGMTIDQDPAYDETNPYINRDPRLTATIVYDGYQWDNMDGTSQTISIAPGSNTPDEYKGPGLNSTATGYYMRKFFDPTHGADYSSGLNLVLIRYADVLLMYAEAKMELGDMNQTVWDQTIRALRLRAGFVDNNALNFNAALSEDELRANIRRERRVELALEGTRIFDIRRWKIAETVLNGKPHGARFGDSTIDNGYIVLEKRTFNPERDYLWPVPQSQRDINSNLGQNPNY